LVSDEAATPCIYYISHLHIKTVKSHQHQLNKDTMTRSRLDNDLSPDQIQWLTIGCFIVVIPAAYMMYRHYLSLKARYPDPVEVKAEGDGQGKKSS
jgi:hypothetical protein